MSTSGGNSTGYLPVRAGQTYLVGAGRRGTALAQNQQIITAPLFCPYPVTITGMGVDVTVAGGAGATVQPAVYGRAANGGPGALLFAGPVLAAATAGPVSGPAAFTMPVGWSWLALLVLAATAPAPTVETVLDLSLGPFGTLLADTGVGGLVAYPFQNGVAALPANFAPSGQASVGPAVWLST